MNIKSIFSCLIVMSTIFIGAQNKKKPNIIIVLADDISAREFPMYNSDTWSPESGGDTQDKKYRAQTPVLNKLAEKGVKSHTSYLY